MNPTQRYLASYPQGIDEFGVVGLDVLDVHLHSAGLLDAAPGEGGTGLGYGAGEDEARTGALGEMTEMVLSARALRPVTRREASYTELVRAEGADRVADPVTLVLEAGCDYSPERPLQWLPMIRRRDGEQVWVPAEFVGSAPGDLPGPMPPGGWLTTPISNGQGAHFDPEAALAHALLELLQRDGNATTFRAMDTGVVIDLDGLADPDSLDLVKRLDAAGIEVTVKLAATDFGTVDVYAVGCSRAGDEAVPVMATACGEAAHPDREVAIRKALHEFVAARSRKALMHGPLDVVARATPDGYVERWLAGHQPDRLAAEDRATEAMLAWTRRSTTELTTLLRPTVFAERTRVGLSTLPSWAGDDLTGYLVDQLGAFDVLTDVRHSDGDALQVKAVVPGLEVETMSYGRIGERGVARLLARDEPLVAVGADPGGWARVWLTADAQDRLGGPAWFDRTAADARVGALYPLYREPGRHVVAQTLAMSAELSRGGQRPRYG